MLVLLCAASQAQRPESPQDRPRLPRVQIKPNFNDVIKATVYADNWFAMYINGKLLAVDPIDFISHNQVNVDVLPEYPMTIAIIAKDNADPKTGLEYGNHIGDAGFVLKFSDGTVTNAKWKAKVFFKEPLNRDIEHPEVEYTPISDNWYAVEFDDSSWPYAKIYSAEQVRPDGNYQSSDFGGAEFIWTDDLDLDNTVIFRYRVEKPDWKARWNTKSNIDNTCLFDKLAPGCPARSASSGQLATLIRRPGCVEAAP